MSGVGVIRTLIAANSGVLAVVPASRIRAGILPLETAFPAISISQISSVPLGSIRNSESKLHVDRVQVTVHRKEEPADSGYPGLKSLLDLILAACPSQRATIAGVNVDSITPDTEGPDGYFKQTESYSRSRDFIVRYSV